MVSKSHGSTKKIKQGHKGLLLIFLLIFICISVSVVHWPALSSQALSFDDEQYLSKNILVQNPSWASVVRFFTEVLEPSTVQGYYQPLTMISLMADYAQGGRSDNLRCVHRTSLILHTLNTALVVLLLYLLFDRVWAAAAAGLLFGLHPITVEMICWVSNRKDLLAVFFSLLSLIYYVKYTKNTEYRIQ